jgi:hypothetical protein
MTALAALKEEDFVRVKDLDNLKIGPPPSDAAGCRGYKNTVLMEIGSLQKNDGDEVYQWGLKALSAKSDRELMSADGFPRLDRMLAKKLQASAKTGNFGLVFQTMVEESRKTSGSMPSGRQMLRRVFSEYDLERQRGGMIGQAQLLNLKMPAAPTIESLETFRDKVIFVRSAIEDEDLPKESTLECWLFENIKNHPKMASTVEKYHSAFLGSHRRSYQWLFSRLEGIITIHKHDVNARVTDAALARATLVPSAKVPGAPAPTPGDDVEKKKRVRTKKPKGDAVSDAVSVAGAPGAPAGKGKGGKADGKGKTKSSTTPPLTPRGALTDAEKKRTPCMFLPYGMCKAGAQCGWLHSDTVRYTGPTPRAVVAAQQGKTPGAVAMLVGASAFANTATGTPTYTSHAASGASSWITRGVTKVVAGVAKVLLASAMPQLSTPVLSGMLASPNFGRRVNVPMASACMSKEFEIEWISDTGAGRTLSSLANLPPEVSAFVRDTKRPVSFTTGGGDQSGGTSVSMSGSTLIDKEEVYMLPKCPNALCTGIQVQERRRGFVWLPDTLPFYIKADQLKRCTIQVPETARINADRVEQNVPMFKEKVTVTYALPGQPSSSSNGSTQIPRVDEWDELSLSELGALGKTPMSLSELGALRKEKAEPRKNAAMRASPLSEVEAQPGEVLRRRPAAVGRGTARGGRDVEAEEVEAFAAQEETEDVPEDEILYAPQQIRDLRAEALSAKHLCSHLPKNPYCDVCMIGKMLNKRSDNNPDHRADVRPDGLPVPQKFAELMMTDTLILAKGERDAGKAFGGERVAQVVKDSYSGLRQVYPQTAKSSELIQRSFRRFTGPTHVGRTNVVIKSDAAPEIASAVVDLGWLPESSVANSWPHNAQLERDIRTMKEAAKCMMLQSGFDHGLWPIALEYAGTCLSAQLMAYISPQEKGTPVGCCKKELTQWAAATGQDFAGPMVPLGALVFFKDKTPGALALAPGAKPGIFAGWRIESGLRYRKVLRILDLVKLQAQEGRFWQPADLYESEVHIPRSFTFPLANAKKAKLEGRTLSLDTPEIEPPSDLLFDEESEPPVRPLVRRRTMITLNRQLRFGNSDGCAGCFQGSGRHTDACHTRFAGLIEDEEKKEEEKKAAKQAAQPAAAPVAPVAEAPSFRPPPEVAQSSSAALAATLGRRQGGLPVAVCVQSSECRNAHPDTQLPDKHELKQYADKINHNMSQPPHYDKSVDSILQDAMSYYTTFSNKAYDITSQAIVTAMSSHITLVSQHCRQLASTDQALPKLKRSSRSSPVMFEFACAADSMMGQVHGKYGIDHMRLHIGVLDLRDETTIIQLLDQLDATPGADVWGSIPCTVWCRWQQMAIHRYGEKYQQRLEIRRSASLKLLRNYFRVAERALANGGRIAFEWPKSSEGWLQTELLDFVHRNQLYEATFAGCNFGLHNDEGHPIQKDWRVVTSDFRLANNLNQHKCSHGTGFEHAHTEGKYTSRTAFYPPAMCECIAASLYPEIVHAQVPAMSCVQCPEQRGHRDKLNCSPTAIEQESQAMHLFTQFSQSFCDAALGASEVQVPALVTRLLNRKEMMGSKLALGAVRKEADGLEEAGTWDLSSVREKHSVTSESRQSGVSVHFGQLMSICSEKFAELQEHLRVLKGRIVYRGDIGRDEYGSAAVYQDLAANPTSVQGLNHCVAYGRLPGHKTTAADAIKAYVQSTLNAKQKTWIELPPELQPESWRGKYTKPVVLLIKSLYGHPEAGAHWEKHLDNILRGFGGKVAPEFPSNYYFKGSELLLTVYVDDLTLSGPAHLHDQFWTALREKVDLEPPTELSRVLGRYHDNVLVDGVPSLAFNMCDYAKQCCELYSSLPGAKPLKHAPTPFCPDGSLVVDDDDVRGELAGDACKALMKCLWLGRLARPDIVKPIGDLATQVQKWSKNCDRQLYRLVCYIHATLDYQLVGKVCDPADQLHLSLYVDADFAGDRLSVKSTSGGYLVLIGPSTFFPLAWVSKKQTSVSRSTTESEVVSLAHGLYHEALPALSLWETLLQRTVNLEVCEDNQATIMIVKKGYSPKLRHVSRTHKVNLACLSEHFGADNISIRYISTDDQAADIFTKGLEPQKWGHALEMLGIQTKRPPIDSKR